MVRLAGYQHAGSLFCVSAPENDFAIARILFIRVWRLFYQKLQLTFNW